MTGNGASRDPLERVEELVLRLVDGQASEAEIEELDRLVGADQAAQARCRALLEQEVALRGERPDLDLVAPAMARLRQAIGARVEDGVMSTISNEGGKRGQRLVEAIEGGWHWLGGRRFWQLAGALTVLALIVVGVQGARVAWRRATPQEAFLYGQRVVSPGSSAAFRVLVRDAAEARPVAGARVEATLRPASTAADGLAAPLWHQSVQTDARGMVLLQPRLAADLATGDYTLHVATRSAHGESEIAHRLRVERSWRVMIGTDKPIYQPGQTIRMRALVLDAVTLRPAAGQQLELLVKDAKDNKVFKKQLTLSRFGIAGAEFALADQVNQGRYTIVATVGDASSERTVTVERYRLPRFRVGLRTDRSYYQPGEAVRGELLAVYTFGQPVAGARVELAAKHFIAGERTVASLVGKTDGQGRLRFALPLGDLFVGQPIKGGDAPLSLEAKVIDATGHEVEKSEDLTVTDRPLRVELFAESGKLVPGVKNTVYLVAAYADGRPAEVEVEVEVDNAGPVRRLRTSAAGVGQLELVPTGLAQQVTLVARDRQGLRAQVSRTLDAEGRDEALLLRTDRAVYRGGQSLQLTVLAGRPGRVFVDVVKDRRTQLTHALTVDKGHGTLVLDLPPELFGTLELHAYRVLPSGEMFGDTRVVQVNRPGQLKIAAELDRPQYRPAQKALLKLAVSRADGSPVQAALGLAGVDEAVFALHELQPGLARVYFMLQQELLQPRYEIHARAAVSPGALVDPAAPRDRAASAAMFAVARGQGLPPRVVGETFETKRQRVSAQRRAFGRALLGGGTLTAVLCFFLLVAPLVAYSFRRLRRREVIEAAPGDLSQLARGVRWLTVWWVLGYYLPLGGLLLGALFNARRDGMMFVLGLGSALLLLTVVQQVRWVLRLRRDVAMRAVPLLRKAVTPLPAAFALAWGCAPLIIATQDRPRALSEGTALLLFFALVLAVVLVAALLAAAGRSVTRPTSAGRWLAVVTGRFMIVGGLPLLLGLGLVMTLGGAMRGELKMAAAPDMALPGLVVKSEPAAAGIQLLEGKGRGGRALKAPTRVRRHFPETLIWRPELITDAQGRAELEIPLADSITTWRLSLSAVSGAGELGAATKGLRVFQPFFVDLDFPVALTQGDRIEVPVAIYSYLDRPQTVRLELQRAPWLEVKGPTSRTVRVGPRQVTSVRFSVVAGTPGEHALTVKAFGSELADAVERRVRVEPDGQRITRTINGQLRGTERQTVTIPRTALSGASDLVLKIHPGAFSQLVEGLDSIFAMPYGCFEQTSSTTYPNVLVIDYLRRTKQVKPEVELKALRYIGLGYQRLLSFEVDGGGFEWFGQAPAHNVLTAYGLMEFADMRRVFPEVDPALIARTREWLLAQQRGDGSWEPTSGGIAEGAINAYRGQNLRTTAYVAWALLESRADLGAAPDPRVDRALDFVARQAADERDPYTLATAANALIAGGRDAAARRLLQGLGGLRRKGQEGGVYWEARGESITHSGGKVLQIETTALVAYALIKAGHGVSTAHRALNWLMQQKDARGTWHSTQATVLALRALLAGTVGAGKLERPVQVAVSVGARPVERLTITPETSDVLRLVSLREQVKTGDNVVEIAVRGADAGRSPLSYQLVATHYLPWAKEAPTVSPDEKELTIDVRYDATSLRASDRLGVQVELQYHRPGTARMLIVDLGLPPGFDLAQEDFEALKARGVIERYAVSGRQVTVYLRQLARGQPLSFGYGLRARHPLRATAPKSRIYKYYQPEVEAETRPVKLEVL